MSHVLDVKLGSIGQNYYLQVIYISEENINILISDSAWHRSEDICPAISQIVLKIFIKISLIIKECPDFFG